MDYGKLFAVADRARAGKRLTEDDIAFVRDTAPADLAAFPKLKPPKSVKHPAGFTISGAPVRTFTQAALLLAGRKVFGGRYEGSDFYQRVETHLAFGIMRSNFHGGAPKGAHCCSQCTLAVLPVLEANALHYFDCKPLAHGVRQLIHDRGWRFSGALNAKMLKWSLEGP